MNEIVYQKGYEEYRAELGAELASASESFVRIGYLLKVARDTDILKYTSYTTYVDFAKAEYGLDKTQVSRFIRINDRFSEGGNSLELKDEYKGFGTRKLGVMLTLPEEITEELSPEYTVEDIETIHKEVKEEQKITPLDDYIEKVEAEQTNDTGAALAKDDILVAAVFEIGKAYPEVFERICTDSSREIQKILAPIADQMYIVRVMGTGKLMVICKESEIVIVNARTNEKISRTWIEMAEAWKEMLLPTIPENYKEAYKYLYEIDFPEKEVAPVQLDKKEQKPNKPDSKKVKTPVKPKVEHKEEPKVKEDPKEEIQNIQETTEAVPEVEIVQEQEELEIEKLTEDDALMDLFVEWQSACEKFSSSIKRNDKAAALSNIHSVISKAEQMRNLILHKDQESDED
ncbi:MAG: hypothetical protein J5537_01695 [Lachnospiraceae bacterium]|nr:hypothetical protein [Lachnospiraceae bacterium]